MKKKHLQQPQVSFPCSKTFISVLKYHSLSNNICLQRPRNQWSPRDSQALRQPRCSSASCLGPGQEKRIHETIREGGGNKRRWENAETLLFTPHNSQLFNLLQEGPSRYGIESDPALVYYEKQVPAVFEGDLDVTDSGIFSLNSMKPEQNPL